MAKKHHEPKHQPASDKTEVDELKDQLARIQADFANFKRRTEEAHSRVIQVARADLILELLPVIDNFELAFKDVPKEIKDSSWLAGVQAIKQQFEGIISGLGIERIKSVGELFDPNLHEAVAHEASKEYDKDIISEEFAAGYKLGDQVIRHSKVKVSSGQVAGHPEDPAVAGDEGSSKNNP